MEKESMWRSAENVAVYGWATDRGYLARAGELLAEGLQRETIASTLADEIARELADGMPGDVPAVYRDLLEASIRTADYQGIATALYNVAEMRATAPAKDDRGHLSGGWFDQMGIISGDD